jgi:hypothetical protein
MQQTIKINRKDIIEIRGGVNGKNLGAIQDGSKIKNIVINRNLCLNRMCDQDFGIMVDNDCQLLERDSIEKGLDLLMSDRETVAVAMKEYSDANADYLEGEHINMGCVIFPYSFHRLGIKFRFDEKTKRCECGNLCDDIRAIGKRIRHLDNVKRIENTHKHQWKEAA